MGTFFVWLALAACTRPVGDTGVVEELEACPRFDDGASTGTVENGDIVEASGLAASRVHADVLWTHNDSGDSARLFALGTDGSHRAEVRLDGITPFDWEDMAAGPGPNGEPSLYLADFGDNAEVRTRITFIRLPEPADLTDVAQTTAEFALLHAEYPDGAHNAEALLVDPRTAELFVITKVEGGGPSGVYRYPPPQRPDEQVTLEKVGELAFGSSPLEGSELVTAADISPDGSRIAVRTYSHVWLWRRGSGTVAEALAGEVCEAPVALEPQGEAVAFHAAGPDAYFTLSEAPVSGLALPLFRFAETATARR